MIVALITSLSVQVEVALRLAEKEEADRRAIAALVLPDFDASDASVIASAAHFCGATDECKAGFIAARDRFVREAAVNGKKARVLKFLKENADGPHANWRYAVNLYDATYNPPAPPRSYRITTTCRTTLGKRSAYTTCTTY